MAYGKEAYQIGSYDGHGANRAVDGLLGSQDGNISNCAHPASGYPLPAQFYVDLGETYRILNVTIFNTYDVGGK